MNEELAKIRELRGYNEIMGAEPEKIKEEYMTTWLQRINSNMAELYQINLTKEYDEKIFINRIIDNIYIILNMFNEMHVYPGYFFRKVFEMNAKYLERKSEYETQEENVRDNNKIKGDYIFFRDTNLSDWLRSEIRKGFANGYYRIQASPRANIGDLPKNGKNNVYVKTNISDAFLEILALFQKYNIPYKITNKEECQKVFNYIYINFSNNISTLYNSGLEFIDISCLCRLLYEYVSFFVSIGVNPKKYLDAHIEEEEKKRMEEIGKVK